MTAMWQYPALAQSGFQLPHGFSMSAYEGASMTGRMSNWGVYGYGPNDEIDGSLDYLRARTRDAVRNNPWANAAIDAWVANIVGTGIRPRWRLDDEAVREKLHDLWNAWVEESDPEGAAPFYGQQAQVCRGAIDGGNSFARRRIRPLSWGLSVPLQIQVIEGDQLAESKNDTLANGNTIRLGVERNKRGKILARHFYKHHPGERRYGFVGNDLETVRVPEAQIAHIYRIERPGQLLGAPWFASVLVRLRELDQYEDAELVRKKTAAMFAAFVEEAAVGQNNPLGIKPNQLDALSNAVSLEPGLLQYLKPGQKIQFSNPADVGITFEPWLRYQLLSIAQGIGVTYEMLTGDLRGVSYSSIRAGLMEFRRKCEMVQHHMMVFQFCRPVVNWWLDLAVSSGAIKLIDYVTRRREYCRVTWRPQAWDWVDPENESNAAIAGIRAGLKQRSIIAQSLGYDTEEIDRENAALKKRYHRDGLVYTTDASQTDNRGAARQQEKISHD
jgi:lambda family phage portal protein